MFFTGIGIGVVAGVGVVNNYFNNIVIRGTQYELASFANLANSYKNAYLSTKLWKYLSTKLWKSYPSQSKDTGKYKTEILQMQRLRDQLSNHGETTDRKLAQLKTQLEQGEGDRDDILAKIRKEEVTYENIAAELLELDESLTNMQINLALDQTDEVMENVSFDLN
ncbi:uncharacterized protein LOC110855302 isoform X2 [Folsomia candida]|uniref:uncharacterized protein LOC110855302 isoform X2 n=1 Tax=Folsomia candida TaxID=158441 RepID=UPI001604BDF5|nr:uncharacterized protein LOC110855302 isoform X2 [Folsomia candida]